MSELVEDTEYDEYEEEIDKDGPEGDIQEVRVEELLINCVEARPPLWDSRLPLVQRSKTIRDELWLEIYQEFGEQPEFSVKFLMNKWRNLRDTYVRVKNEYESYKKSGSASKKKKIWEFYEHMLFLKDTLNHRPTTGNIVNTQSLLPEDNPLKKATTSKQTAEMAIINALEKINSPVVPPPPPPPSLQPSLQVKEEVNPICLRISEILHHVPQGERTILEIKLMQTAYEGAKKYLQP